MDVKAWWKGFFGVIEETYLKTGIMTEESKEAYFRCKDEGHGHLYLALVTMEGDLLRGNPRMQDVIEYAEKLVEDMPSTEIGMSLSRQWRTLTRPQAAN